MTPTLPVSPDIQSLENLSQTSIADSQPTTGIVSELHKLPKLFDELALDALSPEQYLLIKNIDSLLPQTQCGLCGYADGCLPYAAAIVTQQQSHNLCVPGGQKVTDEIASLLGKPRLAATASRWQTDVRTQRPMEVRAIIREEDCIGCTKCIPACPVDAIIGAGKQMHTIFTDLCTGCELCLPPCPMDCIELVPYPRHIDDNLRKAEQQYLRQRYYAHLDRLQVQVNDSSNEQPVISMVQSKLNDTEIDIDETHAKITIEAAKIRSQIKKLERQLAVNMDTANQHELAALQEKLANLNQVMT